MIEPNPPLQPSESTKTAAELQLRYEIAKLDLVRSWLRVAFLAGGVGVSVLFGLYNDSVSGSNTAVGVVISAIFAALIVVPVSFVAGSIAKAIVTSRIVKLGSNKGVGASDGGYHCPHCEHWAPSRVGGVCANCGQDEKGVMSSGVRGGIFGGIAMIAYGGSGVVVGSGSGQVSPLAAIILVAGLAALVTGLRMRKL